MYIYIYITDEYIQWWFVLTGISFARKTTTVYVLNARVSKTVSFPISSSTPYVYVGKYKQQKPYIAYDGINIFILWRKYTYNKHLLYMIMIDSHGGRATDEDIFGEEPTTIYGSHNEILYRLKVRRNFFFFYVLNELNK